MKPALTSILIQILLVGSMALSVTAEARAKKDTKKVEPLSDLKLVEGDEKGNEVRSLKTELLVASAEKKAIEQAHRLIRKYRGMPMEAELHFRLAELYMRKAKTDRFFEIHRHSETVVKFAPRLARSASSKATIRDAISRYAMIQKRFPGFEQMDLVIFNQAFAYQTLGDDSKAEPLYRHLVKKYPDSLLVPDSYLALGEIEFNRNRFSVALEHFNAIRKYPDSRVYPYGLYKAAWTHYNLRDALKGLKTLEEVVAYGKMVAEKGIDARLDLRKEALEDMTLFFEEVYPSKNAYSYFLKQAGKTEVGPILLRLASLYERHSRFSDQRIVLDQFIDDLPHSPLLPQVHNDLVSAHDHMREKPKAVARMEDFYRLCQKDARWVKSQGKTDQERVKAAEECITSLNTLALRLARKWLSAWKKIPADTTYADSSEQAFEIYLRTPATTEEYATSRFAYAELLFARKKFRKASDEYAKVTEHGKAPKLNHDASYAAVLSLEKAVGDKWSAEDEARFHDLAKRYVTQNPKGKYRLDVEYKMALLAYEKNRYDEAAPIFLKLGSEFAGQEKGLKSQDLYLDILNIKKDYQGIRDYTKNLLKSAKNGDRQQKLRKLTEQAHFLQVQGLEEKGQLKEALNEYQAFTKQHPKSELLEPAIWNTMQLQFKLNEIRAGSETAVEYATKFPKAKNVTEALLKAAQSFETMGQLKRAAQVLEMLAAKDEKSARKWKELAADFYALDGQPDSARKIYTSLNKEKIGSDLRVSLMTKLDALEKSYGDSRSQAAIQRQIIEMNIQPQAGLAKVARVESLFEQGKYADAFNEARQNLSSKQLNAHHKARLRLVQAKVLEKEFMDQSVKARAEKVVTVLAIKTEKLQKAQEALQSAIKFGDPKVSMDAFERLYRIYHHYVKALKEMPTPTGLSAEDAQAFRTEIDNLVIPLEEKSVETLAQAFEFARKNSVLDDTAMRLERELDQVNHQTPTNYTMPLSQPEIMLPVVAGVGS